MNVVAPGAIATDFSGGVVRDNPDMNKRVTDMTALGRAGLPDDIGPMIASLLSEDNRWSTPSASKSRGAWPSRAWFRICPFWVTQGARKLPAYGGRILVG